MEKRDEQITQYEPKQKKTKKTFRSNRNKNETDVLQYGQAFNKIHIFSGSIILFISFIWMPLKLHT